MDKLYITSLHNAAIKQVKELQQKKAARKKQGLFVVEGTRAVKEIPAKAGLVQYVVVTEKLQAEVPAHLETVKCYVVTEEIFAKISETASPQGMMAVVKMPQYTLEDVALTEGAYLILENLQDPGNLGTIIRSAHAFGFKAIFMTKGCTDVYSPKVVRATMSSLFYMPLITEQCIEELATAFKAAHIPLYVTALQEGSVPVQSIRFTEQAALIIGNEGNGVSEACLQQADHTMIIPMPGGAESLNASVAAAICMYEMTRSKNL